MRLPLKWTTAYNLTRGQKLMIPFDWFYAINQFNGPSAGNCVEEAILQGICEVVERHVSSIISRDKLETPALDLTSISDPVVLELIGKYEQVGVRLAVTDFTLDTGIPSVGVLAYDPSTFPKKSEIVWTAGTTPDPQKSLSRALTEVAQLAGDFNTTSNYVASGLPKFRELSEADHVLNSRQMVSISHLPDLSHNNFRIEIERCVNALSTIGMDVILVDITNPALQIPAFYTIIPGAHFRERATGTSVGMFAAKLITEGGDPQWAIHQLQEMEKILPGKYYTQFFLGLSHLSLNEPAEALKHLETALELDPEPQDIPSIYSYMGVSLKELEQYKRAITVLEKAEAWDDERTDIHNLMGFCYFMEKDHEKAIECFQKVLKLDPGSAIDYANIASNYRDMGDTQNAIRYYRFALELDPGIEFAWENLKKLEQGNSR
jgi:ribosomal protein S12 methylthiotransferase accessory factor